MSTSDRQRASYVFANSSPGFSKKTPFDEAFPEIENYHVRATSFTYDGPDRILERRSVSGLLKAARLCRGHHLSQHAIHSRQVTVTTPTPVA